MTYACPYCLLDVKRRTWRRHLRKVHGVTTFLNGTPFIYPPLTGPFF